MSFDLSFYSKKELDRNNVFDFLKSLQLFTLSDERFEKICQFWYENQDTNVYFSFDLSKVETDKELWWDLTTPGGWSSHVGKYPGAGIPITHK